MKSIFAFLLLVVLMSCSNDKTSADTVDLEEPAADAPTADIPANTSPEDIPAPNDGMTAASEVYDDDPYLVSNGYFLGLTPGGSMAEFVDGLRSGVLQTGEGDFDVHYIDSAEGDELGYVMADPRDEGTIGNIFITSTKVVTEEGIRVGMSFTELQEKMGELEVHGSEIEGQTYANSDGLSFRLDAGNWSYEIDPSTIKPETKILEIVVER
jgi:hypothetical protein